MGRMATLQALRLIRLRISADRERADRRIVNSRIGPS
jgi:hypothetical protein